MRQRGARTKGRSNRVGEAGRQFGEDGEVV
jgi:hypothetical protein